jgi:hypothetical protein
VAAEYPDIVGRLTRLIEQGAAKLGDALTDVRGSDQGEIGERAPCARSVVTKSSRKLKPSARLEVDPLILSRSHGMTLSIRHLLVQTSTTVRFLLVLLLATSFASYGLGSEPSTGASPSLATDVPARVRGASSFGADERFESAPSAEPAWALRGHEGQFWSERIPEREPSSYSEPVSLAGPSSSDRFNPTTGGGLARRGPPASTRFLYHLHGALLI